MPFRSKRQARYLAARHPAVFRRWTKEAGGKVRVSKAPRKGRRR